MCVIANGGKRSRDGANAWTNLAFFDGHVSLFATEPLTTGRWPEDKFFQQTIWWAGNQKGK